MTSQNIGYIFTGIFVLILLMSFLLGFKRGLKKSFFRFCWIAICAVILYFVTPMISDYLNSFDLTSYNINILGPVHKLSDIGVNILNSLNLDPSISSSPAVVSFMQNLPTMILNVVVFVVLFFVVKWILWIPWVIIATNIFDKEKREKKKYEKRVRELKKNGMPISEEDSKYVVPKVGKNRFAGGVVGLLAGLLICGVAFSPVIGINAIYQNAYANVMTTNEENEQVPYLTTVIKDQTILDYANSYENSIAKSLTKYSGVDFVANFFFGNMAVVNVNNQKVKLVDEVDGGIKAYNHILKITDFINRIDSVKKEDIDQMVSSVKELFFDLKNSKLIYILGDDLLPRVIDSYVMNNENFKLEVGGVDYADLIKEAYTESTKDAPLTMKSLQNQVDAVADIVLTLNNNNLAVPILKGEIVDLDSVANLVSTNIGNIVSFASTVVDKLFSISLLESQYPMIVDDLISLLYESLDITPFVSNKDNISQKVLTDNFSVILSNALEFLKYFETSNDLDFGENTTNAFACVGKVVDSVKNGILSEESYQSLVNFAKRQITDLTSSFADLSTTVEDLSLVTCWEDELRSLSPLYKAVIRIKNDENPISFDAVLDGSYDISFVGGALQEVVASENSKLINNKNLRDIFESVLGKIEEGELKNYLDIKIGSAPSEGIDNRPTIRQKMLENIWDGTQSEIVDWGNELSYSLNVLINLNKTFVDFDATRLSQTDNNELKKLGKSIDLALANSKLFLSNSVLKSVFEYFINNASLSTKFDEIMGISFTQENVGTTVKTEMLNNIYNENANKSNILSWENEMTYLKNMFGDDISSTDLSVVGGVLDKIAGSNLLSRKIVKELIVHYIDSNDSVVALEEGIKNGPLLAIKNTIKNDNQETETPYTIKYEDEIKNLLDLVERVNGTYSADASHSQDWNKFNAIGLMFNQLCKPYEDESAERSNLLTKQVLNTFLAYYINKFEFDPDKSDLESIIKEIPGENNSNLNNIVNYQVEFTLLIELIELVKVDSSNLTDIGTKLDEAKTNSKIIPVESVIIYYIEKNVPTDYSDIANLIKRNIGVDGVTYATMFTQINTLKGHLDTLTGITDVDTFKSSNIGSILDIVETTMDQIRGKEVAYEMAKKLFEKLVEIDSSLRTTIDNLKTEKGFANHLTNTPTENYYTDMIGDLKKSIPPSSST